MTSLWAAALVLGGCVFVHELGHFIAARLCGVEVKAFSLGFGPRLAGIQTRTHGLPAVPDPPGRLCQNGGASLWTRRRPPEKEAVSFAHQKVGRRLIIVGAGPVMNFVMAVVIFGIVLFFYGQPTLIPHVGQVLKGFPAEAAGIKTGDLIVGLNDREVKTWEEMAGFISSNGSRPVKVTVKREKKLLDLTMIPKMGESSDIFGETINKPMIGISPSGQTIVQSLGPGRALVGGFVQTWSVAKLTWETIVRLIQRRIPFSTLGGPIFIAQAAGQQAKSGWVNLFFFMGLLSVNLGILNILPIPVLDGGHLLFFSIEAAFRRPVSLRIRERAQQAGLVFLLVFFGFVFYNDILRLVAGPLGGPVGKGMLCLGIETASLSPGLGLAGEKGIILERTDFRPNSKAQAIFVRTSTRPDLPRRPGPGRPGSYRRDFRPRLLYRAEGGPGRGQGAGFGPESEMRGGLFPGGPGPQLRGDGVGPHRRPVRRPAGADLCRAVQARGRMAGWSG